MSRHLLPNGVSYYDDGDVGWGADMRAAMTTLDLLRGSIVSVTDFPGAATGNPSAWTTAQQDAALHAAVASGAPTIYVPDFDSARAPMIWKLITELVMGASQTLWNPNGPDTNFNGGAQIQATTAMRSVIRMHGAGGTLDGITALGGSFATSAVEVDLGACWLMNSGMQNGTDQALYVNDGGCRLFNLITKANTGSTISARLESVDGTVTSCKFTQGAVVCKLGGSWIAGGANHWTGGPGTAVNLWVAGNGNQVTGVHLDESVGAATPYPGTVASHVYTTGSHHVMSNILCDGAAQSDGTSPCYLFDSTISNCINNQLNGGLIEAVGGLGFTAGFKSIRTSGSAPSGPQFISGVSCPAVAVLELPRVAGDFRYSQVTMATAPNVYPTENKGTNTLSGGTRVVPHGLCATPTGVEVQNISSANGMYVDTITSTQFTVHGTGSDGFLWRAAV